MQSIITHSIIALTVFLMNGCILFKKEIKKPVTVAYKESEIIAVLNSTAFNTKYVGNITPEEISSAFLTNFKNEGSSTKNVKLVNSEEGADYVLKLKFLTVSESSKTEKINDTKSPYHGTEVLLNSIECRCEFDIVNTKKPAVKLLGCFNSKSRSEKLKNNRDLGDLIFQTNKDRTEYRTKLLSDNICKNLAEDVGRRIWVPITRRISKNMK